MLIYDCKILLLEKCQCNAPKSGTFLIAFSPIYHFEFLNVRNYYFSKSVSTHFSSCTLRKKKEMHAPFKYIFKNIRKSFDPYNLNRLIEFHNSKLFQTFLGYDSIGEIFGFEFSLYLTRKTKSSLATALSWTALFFEKDADEICLF